MSKVKIRVKKPYIAYPGSTIQQNYAEELKHGYLLWDIESSKKFDVKFEELSNPKPFVTLDWEGNVSDTINKALDYPSGTRFRIRSQAKIPTKDSTALSRSLKKEFNATEVTFKDHHNVDRTQISTGVTTIIKDDLRNPDILLKLLREYYSGSDMHEEEWHAVYDLLKRYNGILAAQSKARGKVWSIKSLEFSNLFGYGEKNMINFENMEGIVGIFGPNRSGKSSIPGTMMYTFFNSSDRGTIKNKDIVNSRADSGKGRSVFSVDGVDYVIDRSTKKSTNKRGDINASTDLQLYRFTQDSDLESLSGEQRTDTEKTLRELIGTSDDFLLTSLSSQGESNGFLKNGATKRRQLVSRYCDVDVLHKIYDLAKDDVREKKAEIKGMRNVDWESEEKTRRNKISTSEEEINECSVKVELLNTEVQQLKFKLAASNAENTIPVTKSDVTSQEAEVSMLKTQLENKESSIEKLATTIEEIHAKLEKLDELLKSYDLDTMKKSLEAYNKMKASVDKLKDVYQHEVSTLDRHRRTLKILEDVPCGDSFPTCKFIKDAHLVKPLLMPQQEKVKTAKEKFEEAEESIKQIDVNSLRENIKKIEALKERKVDLQLRVSSLNTDRVRETSHVESLEDKLQKSEHKLDELREALFNDENAEVASLRAKIDRVEEQIRLLEKEKISAAATLGRSQSELDQLLEDRAKRVNALQKMKAYEVIMTGFSKKGVPNMILSSLLPMINDEINKILHGIVNFTVELVKEQDSDHVDIILNYGDSRRILELGSGHEKMISSIALRVALINCSTLPKTDIFIIDEGFGVFDAQGVEECTRLLQSLKRYFKAILIISHVDSIKEHADQMIEITKNEKDSKVVFS